MAIGSSMNILAKLSLLYDGANAFNRMQRDIERTSRDVDTKLAGSLRGIQGILGGIAIGFASIKIGGLITDSLEYAATYTEIDNQTRVAFGNMKKYVQDFTATTSKEWGTARIDSETAIAGIGLRLREVYPEVQQNAQESIRLYKRAVDLASLWDREVSEVVQKIFSGLAGQPRPLRDLGVFIEDHAVKAWLAANSFEKMNGEYSQTQKQIARLAILYEQSEVAAGDFALTQDSAANRLRIMQARLKDAQTELGEFIIPIRIFLTELATAFIDRVRELGNRFLDWANNMQKVGEWLNKLGAKEGLIGIVAGAIAGVMIAAVTALSIAFIKLGIAMAFGTGGLSLIIPAVAAVAGALIGFELATGGLSHHIGTILTAIAAAFLIVFSPAAGPLLAVFLFRDKIWQAFRWIADRLAEFAEWFENKFGIKFKEIWENIGEGIHSILNNVIGHIENTINAYVDGINEVIKAFSWVKENIFRQGPINFRLGHVAFGRLDEPGYNEDGTQQSSWTAIKSGVADLTGDFLEGAGKVGGNIVSGMKRGFDHLRNELESTLGLGGTGIGGKLGEFLNSVGLGGIVDYFRTPVAFKDTGLGNTLEGIADAVATSGVDPRAWGRPGGAGATTRPDTTSTTVTGASPGSKGKVEINITNNFHGDVLDVDAFNQKLYESIDDAVRDNRIPALDQIRRAVVG